MARKTKQQRGREFWGPVISRFEGSSVSHREFCRRERLKLDTFRAWLYRIRAEGSGRAPSFVELTSAPAPARVPDCVVRAGATEIEFASRPDPAYLIELVAALGTSR